MIVVRCVRSKVTVCLRLSDDVIMDVKVKVDVFYIICRECTKNGIVFCESRQDWFDVFQPKTGCSLSFSGM